MKFTNMVVLLVCFVMLWGCGGSNVEETPASDAPAEEAASSAVVVNPNLAGADELGALMSKALGDSIMAQRPFLGMDALHPVVTQHLGEEEVEKLYVQMFIPINLNAASEEEILLVPGVGKKMAHEFEEYRPYTAIAQWRREMGKYVDDTEVARMEKYVFVPIDLNTATREEILAVPGVGRRMAREFQEYRPYSSMEQFRREIGKYVDDGEVARLERYVEIRP
ncbi:MAG: helix-hairpin-helix domain-containing protein [Gemmatimonadota bacterium]|nr:helix-hairpin-helix domain-containing protein [Gemmatimonadota bacterium]